MKLDHDWFPAEIPPNVILGDKSWLYSAYAFVHFRSRRERAVIIGSHSGVYNGSFFDLGESGLVEVGSYSTLVGPKISTNGMVRIGNYCLIAHDVVISDDAYATPGSSRSRTSPESKIVLEDNVWIGARAIVVGSAHIGENSIVAAGSCVTRDVPANRIVAGNPARVIGFVSREE